MSKRLSYKNALKRASNILKDPKRSIRLVERAKETLASKAAVSEKMRSTKKIFSDFIRLVRFYINGQYRDISWKSMLYITAILLYFVTPTDLIPDFLPVTGLLDDATLAVWLYQHLGNEMDKFLLWEANQNLNNQIEKE